MKILVTGGSGFIGSHVVDEYINAGHEVFIADKKNSIKLPFINPKAKYFKINLTNSKKVEKLISMLKPDVINHHAANISLTKSIQEPLYDAKNNITAIINLLESSKNNSVKTFIFASSAGAIYSKSTKLPFTEKNEASPISPYGVSKLASEHYIKTYSELYDLNYVILRYSNVYGPRQNTKLKPVISVFIENLLNDKTSEINNNGDQTRDFIHVTDVAKANLVALNFNSNDFFNISSNTEISIKDLYQLIKKLVKSNIEPIYKEKKIKEQNRSLISNHKAENKLFWKPKYTLKEGLKETINWHEKI